MLKAFFEKIKQNHLLTMALCCGIPLVGIMVLTSLGVLGSWGYYVLFLICPLGHIVMMRGMHAHTQKVNAQPQLKQIDYKYPAD